MGHSADGDERLLSAMKARTNFDLIPHVDSLKSIRDRSILNSNPVSSSVASSSYVPTPIIIPSNVQDPTHIGTKLRNKFLNSSISLRIGNQNVTPIHLQMLIETFPKEIHGLVKYDIYPEDRQNFSSLEKIMHPRVIKMLEDHIVDSEATVLYLKLCKNITSSYMQNDLTPIDRIYNIWYAVYVLRCWRKFIEKADNCTLEQNFISRNAYICIEINAQNLIELILRLRNAQLPCMFLTSLFSSQPCEEFFRQMRSIGTVNYTKINFSIYELLHMISRVEMMYKIIYTRKEIVSPRVKFNVESVGELAAAVAAGSTEEPTLESTATSTQTASVSESVLNLPSDDEIVETLTRAREDALQTVLLFGIELPWQDTYTCDVRRFTVKNMENPFDDSDLDSSSDRDSSSDEDEIITETEQSSGRFEQSSARKDVNYIEVVDKDGSTRKIRKSTFVWSLEKSRHKLSSDRTVRVQDAEPTKKKFKMSATESGVASEDIFCSKAEILSISDWGIFKNDSFNENSTPMDRLLIGIVSGFRYVEDRADKKTDKIKQHTTKYKYMYAPTKNVPEEKKIQVLCIWYNCNEEGIFSKSDNNFAVNMDNYLATMKSPDVKKSPEDNSKETNIPNPSFYVLSPEQLQGLINFQLEN